LTGALIRGFVDATFSEIFCPDWKGGTLYLSHMGEVNPLVAAARPTLEEKEYSFSSALNPAYLACSPKSGPAIFVNLSPGPDDTFRLIAAPVEILKDTRRRDYRNAIRCWMRPEKTTAEFLESYSRLGGTHHSVLLLGKRVEALEAFAKMSGFQFAKV
jgi:L-arabinose isomerase